MELKPVSSTGAGGRGANFKILISFTVLDSYLDVLSSLDFLLFEYGKGDEVWTERCVEKGGGSAGRLRQEPDPHYS